MHYIRILHGMTEDTNNKEQGPSSSKDQSPFPSQARPYPLPEHLTKIATASAQELLRILHKLASRERISFTRPIDPERAKYAVQAGADIARMLEETPPIPTESLDVKMERFQKITERLADPKATEFAKQLYTNLLPTFQQFGIRDAALILVGSAATGGMHLRALAGTSGEKMDLDMALVYKANGYVDFAKLQEALSLQMETMQQGQQAIFVPCERANIQNHHQEHITSETIASLLNKPLTHLNATAMINCFFPSIPPGVNIRQQKILLSHLQYLARENPTLWQNQIDALLTRWEGLYFVKAKYLVETQDDYQADIANTRTQEELNIAQDRTQEIKGYLFKDLLYATRKS